MAGPESGVEPAFVREVISELENQKMIRSAALCGSGGRGFMVLMTADGVSKTDIENASMTRLGEEISSFTWHLYRICNEGL
jgi:hypothetical protein